MKRTFFLLTLLLPLVLMGQGLNRSAGYRGALTPIVASGSSFSPTNIAGMALFWNYKDLVAGSTVSSWVDRLQSLDAHQGDAARQPTNSSLGVYFANPFQLTNVTTIIASNYTVWVRFRPTSVAAGYKMILGDSAGNQAFFLTAATLNYYAGGDHNIAAGIAADTTYDMVWANGATYTNGVAAATTTIPSGNFGQSAMGGHGMEYYSGYIQAIGMWTNTTLSAADAVSLYGFTP